MPSAQNKFRSSYTKKLLDYCKTGLEAQPLKDPSGEYLRNKAGNLIYAKGSFPTVAGFAISIGVCRATLYNWAAEVYPSGHELEGKKINGDFAHGLKMLNEYQRAIIVPGALNGTFNSHFATFFMVNNFDEYEHHTSSSIKAEVNSTGVTAVMDIADDTDPQRAAEQYMEMIKQVAIKKKDDSAGG